MASQPADQVLQRETNNGEQDEQHSNADSLVVKKEVAEAFDGWNKAWNRGDLGGYLDAYMDSKETRYVSESLKVVEGVETYVVLGRKEIDRVFTDVFVRSKTFLEKQTSKKGVAGYLSLTRLDVTPAGPVDAIVFGEFQLEMTESMTRSGMFTIHVKKVHGKWLILSEHATSLPTKTV